MVQINDLDRAWIKAHLLRLLDKGKIEKLVGALGATHTQNLELAEKIRIEAGYPF